jgi:hypothetical protein
LARCPTASASIRLQYLVRRWPAQVPVADHGRLHPAGRLDLFERVADRADAARVQDEVSGRPLDEVRIAEPLAAILGHEEDAGQDLLHQSGFSSSSWPKQMTRPFRSRTINSRPL